MSVICFNPDYVPIARRGFTPIEGVEYIRQQFPEVKNWTFWMPPHPVCRFLGMMVGKGYQTKGVIGGWTWKRIPCGYPTMSFWYGPETDLARGDGWVGVLKIADAQRRNELLLFSFLNSRGAIGQWFFASTTDVDLLNQFCLAVQDHFRRPNELVVQVYGGGRDIRLSPSEDETIVLPSVLQADIEQQVYSFFRNADRYHQMRIRHKRGLLFVGSPGNGKSLLVRHLIRECHRQFQSAVLLLNVTKNTHDWDLAMLFQSAEQQAPALVICEDLDSLTTETQVSRASLLARLDGIDSMDGVLLIATTNNPGQIDPALLQRPSRFDRVWRFPCPDRSMRQRYLDWAFPNASVELRAAVVKKTSGWSYAYLSELRTTAALLAIDQHVSTPSAEDIQKAVELLAAQFDAGKRDNNQDTDEGKVGFGPDS